MTAEKSTIVRNLESALIELTNLYKYTYNEDDLIKLNKNVPIEHIDSTKEAIETPIIVTIIKAVANGLAEPFDKQAYDIIEQLWDELNINDILPKETIEQYHNALKRTGIKKDYMTVQDLIDTLKLVGDKSKPVFINVDNEILPISLVDDDISDRLDLNAELQNA